MSESCNNSSFLKMTEKIIEQASDLGPLSLISKEELIETKKAIKVYKKDCNICNNENNCLKVAQEKLIRSLPFLNKNIYPWKNYDWDYSKFIDNNYSPLETGANSRGKISQLFKNIEALIKLGKGYISDPNPNKSSIAGGTDKNSDADYWRCTKGVIMDGNGNPQPISSKEKKRCNNIHKVKYRTPNPVPYEDKFFRENSTTGKHSSSYFVKIGDCYRPDLDEQKCIKKGYKWMSSGDACYQPRYAYINNKPGYEMSLYNFEGLVPSLAKDFMSLSPDKVITAMQGKNISDLFILQKCPQISKNNIEKFKNQYKKKCIKYNSYIFKNIFYAIVCLCIGFFFVLGKILKSNNNIK